ncbi:hypothetical protein [Candidatus Frankia alpina]|uniref:hypothetical protein n=1 Tax=Candidatus Frankia alpina TaxID=2699483 RepID=UPI0013D1E660|nr:hypothetical protein [Candidatus Frankia alpina]
MSSNLAVFWAHVVALRIALVIFVGLVAGILAFPNRLSSGRSRFGRRRPPSVGRSR